jgi:hypothetical protein
MPDGRFATNGAVCEHVADGRFGAGMDDQQQRRSGTGAPGEPVVCVSGGAGEPRARSALDRTFFDGPVPGGPWFC